MIDGIEHMDKTQLNKLYEQKIAEYQQWKDKQKELRRMVGVITDPQGRGENKREIKDAVKMATLVKADIGKLTDELRKRK